eukprot:COSAG05_NODE_11907_length_490_cov_9.843990_1_plen_70_part_10
MHVNIDLSCLLHVCMCMYSRMAAAAVLACDSACASSTLQVLDHPLLSGEPQTQQFHFCGTAKERAQQLHT